MKNKKFLISIFYAKFIHNISALKFIFYQFLRYQCTLYSVFFRYFYGHQIHCLNYYHLCTLISYDLNFKLKKKKKNVSI